MRISKGFIKSSIIYTVAGTLPLASAVILLPFYIQYLSTTNYGALSLYLAFSLLIQVLTTYSFDTSLYIHYHEYKNNKPVLNAFVCSAFIFMLMIGVVLAFILTVSGSFIFQHIFTNKPVVFYPYGIMAALTGIFQSLFKVHSNLLQGREKPVLFLWSNSGSFFFICVLSIGGLYLYPDTLIGPVGGRLVAAVLSGGWALSRIFKEFGWHFNYTLLRSTFSFNFYTFVYQLLQWIINYLDRFILVFFLSLHLVGIYDFALKCMLVIEFILNGLHNSFYPKVVSTIMTQEKKQSVPEINRYYHGFISIIMVFICGGILLFPLIVQFFVTNPDYQQSTKFLPYVALSYIFRPIRLFFAAPYNILKFMKPLPVIYSVVSILKFLIMIVLVPIYGVFGAIASSIVSSLLETILLYNNISDKFEFRFNKFKIIAVPVILFFVLLLSEFLMGGDYPVVTHLLNLIICFGLLLWVYRKEVRLLIPLSIWR